MGVRAFWHRLTRGMQRGFHSDEWTQFAGSNDVDRIMASATTDRFHAKQGRSTARWVIEKDGRQLCVYLKRHFKLPWWQRVLATIWPGVGWSPALTEQRHLDWALANGIPVPEPVAAGEIIGPWGRLQSFLAVKDLSGMAPVNEVAPARQRELSPRAFHAWKRQTIHGMAELAQRLHQRGRFHRDLYLCHFFTPVDGNERKAGLLHLIDLGRLTRPLLRGWYLRIKDLAQLFYSFDGTGLGERDTLRFFHAYVGEKKLSLRSRWLLWAVRAKANRYRRHNARRTAPLPQSEPERKSVAA